MIIQRRITVFSMAIALLAAALFSTVSAMEAVEIQHDRTVDEIVVKHLELKHSAFSGKTTQYSTSPKLTAPYSAGSLAKEDVNDALNTLKMVRFLAGVPYENIKFTDELNNIAQHGAVLLAASNQFTHTPGKPADMDEAFYKLGYKGCNEANLNAGKSSISGAVLGFIADLGKNNISSVGHRRWLLKPGGESFGIGFAKGNGSYGGYRTSIYVFDGKGPYDSEPDTFTAWPSPGAFPIQYFTASINRVNTTETPWSISLGAEYAVPDKKNLNIKLTRASDGKVWHFDSSTPDLQTAEITNDKLHLSVDNSGSGMRKTIVFRPDLRTLGEISDGETFAVEISGINYADGSKAILRYNVSFFDLNRAVKEYEARLDAIDNMSAGLPSFPVTMNGVTVDNLHLKYPFITCNGITYFPMTYHDSRFLGIGTGYTEENGLVIVKADGMRGRYYGEKSDSPNPAEFTVSAARGKISVNGRAVNNAYEEYPLLLYRNVTYFPMTWRFCVDEFGWAYEFDEVNGLVINTD